MCFYLYGSCINAIKVKLSVFDKTLLSLKKTFTNVDDSWVNKQDHIHFLHFFLILFAH